MDSEGGPGASAGHRLRTPPPVRTREPPPPIATNAARRIAPKLHSLTLRVHGPCVQIAGYNVLDSSQTGSAGPRTWTERMALPGLASERRVPPALLVNRLHAGAGRRLAPPLRLLSRTVTSPDGLPCFTLLCPARAGSGSCGSVGWNALPRKPEPDPDVPMLSTEPMSSLRSKTSRNPKLAAAVWKE